MRQFRGKVLAQRWPAGFSPQHEEGKEEESQTIKTCRRDIVLVTTAKNLKEEEEREKRMRRGGGKERKEIKEDP